MRKLLLITLLSLTCFACFSAINGEFVYFIEQTPAHSVNSSVIGVPDTIPADSALTDTLIISNDTVWYRVSGDALDDIINYSGADSVVYDLASGKTYIYSNAEITYQTYHLKADYIEFDWDDKTIIAKQLTDSLGNKSDLAWFQEGDDEFTAEDMTYNFGTKKGSIHYFRKTEGEGFITADSAKKSDDNSYFGKHLSYTTCNLDHPHFYITANKAKVVPKKIAVTGPANLVIADVPTPLFLPFGIFPIKRGQTSGILIPQYGNSYSQGFFLRNGGYYFALSDHYDLSLTGDIYTRGSWGMHASSRYNMRYKYSGNVSVDYTINKYGFDFAPDFSSNKGFFVRWNHTQSAGARPNSKFGASVNVGTTDFLSNNAYNASYLTNQLNSSISYSRIFPNTPFTLTAALRHSQSTSTHIVDLTIPDISLTMNRIYPFKNLTDNRNSFLYQLGVSYSMNTQNSLSVPDSLLWDQASFDKFRNGVQHRVTASAPVKLFKYFTLSPNANYTENWYFETYRKNYAPDTLIDTSLSVTGEEIIDTTVTFVNIDTVAGFRAARYFNAGASLNTKLYATATFNGKLKAIRHVMTPTVSFNYSPDFSDPKYGYFGDYYTSPDATEATPYSVFDGTIYGGPTAGEVGSIGLSLGNILEMKVYSKKDSVAHEKKIKIFESLTFGTSYNLAADSLNLADIFFNGYTTLFEKVHLNFSGSFDPYIVDTLGRSLDQFEWDVNNRLGRFNGGYVSLSTSFESKRNENPGYATNAGTEEEREMVWANPEYYIDFEVPWSFDISYNLRITNTPTFEGKDSLYTTQSATFSADLNLTPKWKIQVTSGYDFELKDFTYTSLDIYRDLHCWEMGFKWIPFGARQSYIFNINVKASVLQDLKLTRKKDWSEY